jgi:hypothetical protein
VIERVSAPLNLCDGSEKKDARRQTAGVFDIWWRYEESNSGLMARNLRPSCVFVAGEYDVSKMTDRCGIVTWILRVLAVSIESVGLSSEDHPCES